MSTEIQAIANRDNAQASTGPRTPAGKAVSSMNALRHGLRAQAVVLPDEDHGAYQDFHDALVEELRPAGQVETILADRVVGLAWRLRRIGRLESAILAHGFYDQLAQRARAEAKRHERTALDDLAESLSEVRVTDEPAHTEALEAVAQAEALRDDEATAAAVALAQDKHDGLAKLTRYETSLERSLLKMLAELSRRQEVRAGRAADAA